MIGYPNDTLPVGSFAAEAAGEIVPPGVLGHMGQHHSLIFVPNFFIKLTSQFRLFKLKGKGSENYAGGL